MDKHSFGRRAFMGGLSVAALSLAACTVPPRNTDVESESSSPAPQDSWTTAASSLITGLSEVKMKGDGHGLDVSTPRVDTARNLTQACEVVRGRFLRGAHWENAKKVAIHSQLLAASTDVVGLAIVAAVNSDEPTSACTLWYDARREQTFAAPELVAPNRWRDFATAVRDAAQKQGLDAGKVGESLVDKAAPYGRGPGIGFNAEGKCVVAFPAGAVSDKMERVVVDAEHQLSEFGRLAHTASLSPAEFSGMASTQILHFAPGATHADAAQSPNRPTDGSPNDVTPTPGGAVRPSTAIGYDTLRERCVALTYDDGPGDRTPEMLVAFKQAKAATTFFMKGLHVKVHSDTALDIACAGHDVGNHTMTHPDLANQTKQVVEEEVRSNSALLKDVTGIEPLLFRAPFGSHNDMVDQIVATHGMALVQWKVDTQDWKTLSTPSTVERAVSSGTSLPEPIILLHDVHPSTIDATPAIIQQLQAAGVHLVTVSELTLNTGGVFPGHSYCRGTSLEQVGYACKG